VSASLAGYVDVEIIKAVVAIKAEPFESHLGCGVVHPNVCVVLHDG
jgi:hypothetical protein